MGLPRPVSFTDLLKASLKLYGSAPFRSIGLCLPVFILALGMAAGLDYLLDETADPLFVALNLASRILFTFVASFAVAACTWILAEAIGGRRATGADARRVLRRSTRDIVLSGLLSCTFLIVFDLLGLTQFLLLAGLGPPFVIHAVVLERREFRSAVHRARELLGGEWGRVMLAILGLVLALILVMFLFGLLVFAPASSLGEEAFDLIVASYLTLAPAITLPYFVAAMLVLYLDVRARKEGLTFVRFEAELDAPVNPAEEGSIQG